MEVIEHSVMTDSWCKKMYECIETDLLGALQYNTHSIAPYYKKGVEKATNLSVQPFATICNHDTHQRLEETYKGGTMDSGLGTS